MGGLPKPRLRTRAWIRMSQFKRSAVSKAPTSELLFIWQYHSLFQRAGIAIADQSDSPLVLYVAAPQVWEAASWGVKRPLWGRLVERFGESPQFARADLVACLSEEVAEATVALGASSDRVIITPCTADGFRKGPSLIGMRENLGLAETAVIGWVGSFRPFHNAEMLVRTVAKLQVERDVALIMIGDGPTRQVCVDLVADLDVRRVIFTGPVRHDQIANFLAVMDVAVITSGSETRFHYSPLKLKEYLAAGKAVVAPNMGEIARLFRDGEDLLKYSAGNEPDMADAIRRILDDSDFRARLEAEGRATYDRLFTMDRQLDEIAQRLGLPARYKA